MPDSVPVADFFIGQGAPLTVVCGPCVIESEEHALRCADFLVPLFDAYPCQLIFKGSYDKANRSSIHSFRGPGLEEGLRILEKIHTQWGVPVLTDVHTPEEATEAGQVCPLLQIPAFLCRQTDLLVAAGRTGAVINIKKGQFMAPGDMLHAVEKVRYTGNHKVLLTDRGVSFGYNNLVSDFRAIPIMQELGCPVLFDATHSVQLPGGAGSTSGGQRQFVALLARAALAAGANGLYIEAHPDPAFAQSDREIQIPFAQLPALLEQWLRIYEAVAPSPTCVG